MYQKSKYDEHNSKAKDDIYSKLQNSPEIPLFELIKRWLLPAKVNGRLTPMKAFLMNGVIGICGRSIVHSQGVQFKVIRKFINIRVVVDFKNPRKIRKSYLEY